MRPLEDEDEMPTRGEVAGRWCVALASGPLAPDEQRRFDQWMAADPANAEAFDHALTVWHGLHAISDAPEIISKRADALDALRRANQRRWARIGRGWQWGLGIAASLVLAVMASVWMLGTRPLVYATGVGERRAFLLDDGSRVSLDAETKVSVSLVPNHRDLRLLAGRAKFDVAYDGARPFTVTAGDRTVIATGTAFSVELIGGNVHVIVYEGKVAVVNGAPPPVAQLLAIRHRPGPGATGLLPGKELIAATAAPTAPQVVQTDVARSLAWEGGQLNFIDEPLAEAIERLNRYTATKIVVGDPRTGAIQINGVFNAGDSAAFVEALADIYAVRSRHVGTTIILSSSTPS